MSEKKKKQSHPFHKVTEQDTGKGSHMMSGRRKKSISPYAKAVARAMKRNG